MPAAPTPAQSEAAATTASAPPAPPPTPARPAPPGTPPRHGPTGRTFFLLADEAETDWQEHEALWLATWAPRDALELAAAMGVIRAMWREQRADRLEVQVLTDLFAAGKVANPAEAAAAKAVALKALGTLLRYRGRIEREHRQAMQALDALRQRSLRRQPVAVRHHPEPSVATVAPGPARAPVRREPEPPVALNRHQRRALQAIERQQRRLAA